MNARKRARLTATEKKTFWKSTGAGEKHVSVISLLAESRNEDHPNDFSVSFQRVANHTWTILRKIWINLPRYIDLVNPWRFHETFSREKVIPRCVYRLCIYNVIGKGLNGRACVSSDNAVNRRSGLRRATYFFFLFFFRRVQISKDPLLHTRRAIWSDVREDGIKKQTELSNTTAKKEEWIRDEQISSHILGGRDISAWIE